MTKLLLITNYVLLTTLYYACSFIYRLKSLHSLAEANDVNVSACPPILIVNSRQLFEPPCLPSHY